jgi:hypothetical protein
MTVASSFLRAGFFASAVALSFAAGAVTAAPASAEAQYSTVGSFAAAYRGSERVCCKRGWHDWWSTARDCRRNRGEPTRNRECRNDRDNSVHSYNDNNGRYNDGYGNNGYNGNGYSGYDTQDPQGNPDRRVCCNSRNGVTWSTWRECRQARGEDVANKACRN